MGFHLFTFASLSFKQIYESEKKNPLFNDVCQLDIRENMVIIETSINLKI